MYNVHVLMYSMSTNLVFMYLLIKCVHVQYSSLYISQKALEAQIRQRLELQDAHDEHLIMKEKKRIAQLAEEEEYRRQLMAKFAEDDRIELMNAQKRRMKQLEHRRAVEKLIEERRQEYQRLKVWELNYRNEIQYECMGMNFLI